MPTRVTDPRILAEFEDREKALRAGVNYDEVAKSYDAQVNKRRTGSVFGDVRPKDRKRGTAEEGFGKGMLGDPLEGATQLLLRGGNKLQRAIGMDPQKGIFGRPGMFSDENIKYNEARRKLQEQEYEEGRKKQGREGFDAARLVGGVFTPIPGGGGRAATTGARALRQAATQGAASAALQPVDVAPGESYWAKKAADTAIGAGAGGTVGVIANRLGRGVRPGQPSETRRVAEAADRLNVPVGMGQITGSRALGRTVHGSANVWGGGNLVRGAQRTEDALEHQIEEIGNQFGAQRAGTAAAGRPLATSGYQAGANTQRAVRGAGGFVDRFNNRADQLYQQVSAHAPQDIDAVGTVMSMQRVANMFRSNPQLGQELQNPRLANMARLIARNPNAPGRLDFNEAQALRSEIGRMMGDRSLLNDIPRGELSQVYRALTQDMRQGLAQTGNPQALRAFDRASRYWQAGRNRIDNTLEAIVGDQGKSPEEVFRSIMAMTQKNSGALYQLRRSMRPEEWDDVASSVFHKLGEVSRGTAGEIGEGFSPTQFMTQLNKLQQTRSSRRAFNAVFGGTRYAQVQQPLRDLATLSNRLKDNAKLANHSGSGYMNSIMALVGASTVGLGTVAKLYGTNYAFSSAMASPRFLRWALGAGNALNGIRRPTAAVVDAVSRRELAKLASLASAGGEGSDVAAGILQNMANPSDPEREGQ